MSNYIYTRGYTVAELEALLVRVKPSGKSIFNLLQIAGVPTPV